MNSIKVFVEIGKKRIFVGVVDWSGWCRSGRDENTALQALIDYGPRYARVLHSRGIKFQVSTDVSDLIVAEQHDGNGFILIHGDVGHNNILVTRDGDRPIYIIDRQPFDWSLTTWMGVNDLANALVLDWEVEIRRRLEVLKSDTITIRSSRTVFMATRGSN